MKGIFKGALVDIVERNEQAYSIQTNYGVMSAKIDEVLEIPSEVYGQYVNELDENDAYLQKIKAMKEDIKRRYYMKQEELDKSYSRAWGRKQTILNEMKFKALC